MHVRENNEIGLKDVKEYIAELQQASGLKAYDMLAGQKETKTTDLSIRLKTYRRKYIISLRQIAKEVGVSHDNLYKWAKGHSPRNPSDYNRLMDHLVRDRETGALFSDGKTETETNLTVPSLLTIGVESVIGIGTELLINVPPDEIGMSINGLCRLGLKKMVMPYLIIWGRLYYVVTTGGIGMVRRIYASADKDRLKLMTAQFRYCDNPDNSGLDIELAQNDVSEIYVIQSVVFNLSP